MRNRVKPVLFLFPVLLTATACGAPTDAPQDPMEDQSVSDNFSSDQPVVDDPMAGDTVVEDSPAMDSTTSEVLKTEPENSDGFSDAAAEDAAKMADDPFVTMKGEKAE